MLFIVFAYPEFLSIFAATRNIEHMQCVSHFLYTVLYPKVCLRKLQQPLTCAAVRDWNFEIDSTNSCGRFNPVGVMMIGWSHDDRSHIFIDPSDIYIIHMIINLGPTMPFKTDMALGITFLHWLTFHVHVFFNFSFLFTIIIMPIKYPNWVWLTNVHLGAKWVYFYGWLVEACQVTFGTVTYQQAFSEYI